MEFMRLRSVVVAVGVAVCMSASAASRGLVSDAQANPLLGFEGSSVLVKQADSSLDLLAGSHPYGLTATIKVNSTTNPEGRLVPEGGDIEDLVAELPAGVTVDPLAVPRCSAEEFATVSAGTGEDGCPDASAVGVLRLENVTPSTLAERKVTLYPIYDLTPPQDAPALFGAIVANVAVYLTSSIRTGSDYGLTVAMTGIPQDVHVLGSTVTFWGVPADPSHDKERGDCIQSHGTCPASVSARAALRLPTQCITSPIALLRADAWQEPGEFSASASDPIAGAPLVLTGCEGLDFSPSFHAQAQSSTADGATGLKLDLRMPQSEDPAGLVEADLKDAIVSLPQGMTLNMARAGNLVGCPLDGPEAINLDSTQPASCPQASKVGTAKIRTPILAGELLGSVYIAQQGNLPGTGTNPFESMLAIYIVAEGSGVVVKLPAEVTADPQTGQLTILLGPNPVTGQTFVPPLPLEEIELEFAGGDAGALVTPSSCGSHTTSSSVEPWSGTASVMLTDQFQITERCARAWSPSFSAGTLDKQANRYSTLTTTLTRRDGEQELKSMSLTTPSGLQATLKGVTLCPEPQASLGACGAQSLIGEATSTLGAGPNPFAIGGGKVYLTGPYGGAPFGLSLVLPAVVGPLNLGPQGHPLVIRAAIRIDPITAQNTIVTDTVGPASIPSILDGILPQIRALDITIDRPEFTFNPTKCGPQPITGTITSTEGAAANVSSPFEATNCASLPFSPRLRASTVGRPSRTNGIGFDVKIVEGVAGEANAQSVKVELPRQLPSRLTTLQKACRVTVFEADPAGCPSGSIVGTATAVTPILPVPMTGPAYFVSHGGAQFPELVIVLQGYGVTIDVHGETFINKAGITSSTFPRIPDAPVSSFELQLPPGKNSALAAHGDLCAANLRTPTTIVAQNGAVVKEDPRVAVGGCRPAIKVLRHSVNGGGATIVVRAPSAGKLTASGSGLVRAKRKLKKAGTVTLRLALTRSERRFLANHRKRRLKLAVSLLFVPSHGSRLTAHVTLRVR
jgi:hypothetical protein